MIKATTWVLIADGARARLLKHAWKKGKGQLSPVFPDMFTGERRKMSEIVSDRGGVGAGPGGSHAMDADNNAQRHAEWAFVKDLSKVLEDGRKRNDYDRLILVAAPKALGDLRKALPEGARDRIVAEIAKDLVDVREDELQKRLAPHLN